MKYNNLGLTDINVSKLCFGTLTLSPLKKQISLNEGVRLLNYAYEIGINFFDTAQLYENYQFLKPLLQNHPEAVICTKSYAYDVRGAQESLDASLRAIGRDYVDIMLMHEQESEHTIRGHYDALEYYIKQKAAGKIRAVGLSTHLVSGVTGANMYNEIEIIHPMINKDGFGILDGSAQDMEKALAVSCSLGKGIFGMKPLGGGHLIKDIEKALIYVRDKECLHSVAVGMQNENEIKYNAAIFNYMDKSEMPEMPDTRAKSLYIHDWCEACGKCVERCRSHALSIRDGTACVDNNRCVLCSYCASVCPHFCIKILE